MTTEWHQLPGDGNSIVTGYFYDTASFGSTIYQCWSTDVFIAKLNADGVMRGPNALVALGMNADIAPVS